jgi:hypothetical protein
MFNPLVFDLVDPFNDLKETDEFQEIMYQDLGIAKLYAILKKNVPGVLAVWHLALVQGINQFYEE